MAMTLRDLVRAPDLGLVALVDGNSEAVPISWATSSDLLDPTPFLVPDQLVLTTGRQFTEGADAAEFTRYVAALQAGAVVGIGFGSEVLREETPAALVDACAEAGMPLVEVPYRTPFLAIIRRVARELERDAHLRDDWALSSLRAISAAALPRGEVEAVLRELATRLAARVLLFDADGDLAVAYPRQRPSDTADEVVAEVRRLIATGTRAAADVVSDDHVMNLQTLGPAGASAGALVVIGPSLDRAARTVIGAAIALIEVGAASSRRSTTAELARNVAQYRLLNEGRVDLADQIAATGSGVPGLPASVVVCECDSQIVLDELASREVRTHGTLVFTEGAVLVCIVPRSAASRTADRLAARAARVGMAGFDQWDALRAARSRAEIALQHAADGGIASWESLLAADEAMVQPEERGMGLLPDIAAEDLGTAELAAAEAWFAANCNWGAAAEDLGMHPHTVRDRVRALAARLGTDLDSFEGRSTLWRMIRGYRVGVRE